VSRGAQEETPGRAGRLCRVLKEMLREVEGVYGQQAAIISYQLFVPHCIYPCFIIAADALYAVSFKINHLLFSLLMQYL